MEKLIKNPGLQHLAEKVFFNLIVEKLKICKQINQSCEQILENPMFWLRKFGEGISKENQKDWIKIIQSKEMNSEKTKAIISYLQWNLRKEASKNLPCYSNPDVQKDFRKKILKICTKAERLSDEETEIVNILAPLTNNPNTPDKLGYTPIRVAAFFGIQKLSKA